MYKKVISAIMISAMLCGVLSPMQYVQATGENSNTQTATENTSGKVTEVTTESTPEVTTEITTEIKTEESTEPTTEVPQNTPVNREDDPNYVVTGLSPSDSKVVLLDPGHCKTHPGASKNGLREEEVVLDIAKACQSKLDKYADVTVYMTRTAGTCCNKLGLGDCLSSRNNYAKQLDADFLISMHINAGSSSGANALVAYKSGYHDNVRKETQAFGKLVLKKLEGLGIKNRGFLLRKSGTGNRYSNGKLADYYSIVRRGVVYNIPSMIIEHGYVTSSSDCNKFFKTKAKRTKVGNADADAIISYYKLKTRVTEGKPDKQKDGTYFITKEGKKALGWVKYNGKWYFFDKETGKMKTGMIEDDGESYFLDKKTGEMKVGWIKNGSTNYIARGDGTIVKGQAYCDGMYTYLLNSSGKQLKMGLHTVNGKTYYVNNKKRVLSGVLNIDGKHYLFDSETMAMCYGYTKQGNKYYYADQETGVLACNKIVTVNGTQYYFGKSGARQTGWVKYKKAKYYFSTSDGKMIKGWKKIKGKYYYFSKTTGKMQKSKWIGNYYVNSKGVRTKKK